MNCPFKIILEKGSKIIDDYYEINVNMKIMKVDVNQ